MAHGTHEPEPDATGHHREGAGTGASLREVGGGRMAPDDPTGRADMAGADQDELEDLYRQSLQDLEEGEVVRGTIVAISDAEVLVDVGYKSEGTIPID